MGNVLISLFIEKITINSNYDNNIASYNMIML